VKEEIWSVLQISTPTFIIEPEKTAADLAKRKTCRKKGVGDMLRELSSKALTPPLDYQDHR